MLPLDETVSTSSAPPSSSFPWFQTKLTGGVYHSSSSNVSPNLLSFPWCLMRLSAELNRLKSGSSSADSSPTAPAPIHSAAAKTTSPSRSQPNFSQRSAQGKHEELDWIAALRKLQARLYRTTAQYSYQQSIGPH
jgi:hypothetical protein